MADRYWLLEPGPSTMWSNDYVMSIYGAGAQRYGITKSYTALSTGQYSGTVAIELAGSTEDKSNNCVLDNRTGLMWTKALSRTLGPDGDGRLYWDDHVDVITHDGAGGTFTYGHPIEQANTTATGVIRYNYSTANNVIAIYNASTRPFSTAAADTITDDTGGGPAEITSYKLGSAEDIWSYVKLCNESSVGGHSDWRIPNAFELLSIMNYSSVHGTAQPSTEYFDTSSDVTAYTTSIIWTGTMAYNYNLGPYAFSFSIGGCYMNSTLAQAYNKLGYTLLCRDATVGEYPCKVLKTDVTQTSSANFPDDGYYQKGRPKSYVVSTAGQYSSFETWTASDGSSLKIYNECIEDLNTGLMWTRYPVYGEVLTTQGEVPYYDPDLVRNDAISIIRKINELNIGGHSDWRLPNLYELDSIYNFGQASLTTAIFEKSSLYCHADTQRPSSTTIIYRSPLSSLHGTGYSRTSTSVMAYVRPVRGGHTDADL